MNQACLVSAMCHKAPLPNVFISHIVINKHSTSIYEIRQPNKKNILKDLKKQRKSDPPHNTFTKEMKLS
jgi:hypothetical protein